MFKVFHLIFAKKHELLKIVFNKWQTSYICINIYKTLSDKLAAVTNDNV